MLELLKTVFLAFLLLIPAGAILYYIALFEYRAYRAFKTYFIPLRGAVLAFFSLFAYSFLVGFFFFETRTGLLDDIFYLSIIWLLLNYIIRQKKFYERLVSEPHRLGLPSWLAHRIKKTQNLYEEDY